MTFSAHLFFIREWNTGTTTLNHLWLVPWPQMMTVILRSKSWYKVEINYISSWQKYKNLMPRKKNSIKGLTQDLLLRFIEECFSFDSIVCQCYITFYILDNLCGVHKVNKSDIYLNNCMKYFILRHCLRHYGYFSFCLLLSI